MKIFKTLICAIFLSTFTQACEPEELPTNQNQIENFSADTGEYGDEVEDSRGNS